jgi:peroxiredoxin-like protein
MSHHYTVTATVEPAGLVDLNGDGLATIVSGPPLEFGGSGTDWSPEDLLIAAVADCFVLAFKAIASASRYDWAVLKCTATGTLDKVERAMQFTEIQINATLTISADADADRAQRLLEKAKQTCFITNSLKAESVLETEIQTA